MCIRDSPEGQVLRALADQAERGDIPKGRRSTIAEDHLIPCLLYTSDAADERSSVDLGGRRIIKKKK